MKRTTVLIFGLFSTSFACAASANEVFFTCDYQLGAETGASREKIGSVAIAIDVKNKAASIDFGKGWFKTNTLQVHGAEVKETAPSTSGQKLGLFYFDLKGNSGGFSGEGVHEFFGACVQDATARDMAVLPQKTQPSTTIPDHKMIPNHKEQTTVPATATEKTIPSSVAGEAITEYFGNTESRTKPAWAAQATMNPTYKEPAARSAAVATAVTAQTAPPQTGGKATIEYYGGTAPRANPAWAAEAKMNLDYDKTQPPMADASTESPGVNPVPEAAVESCKGALSVAVRAANLYFANSSFVVYPRSKADLRKIAKTIDDCGNVLVEVGGHTDSFGDPIFNKTLSQLRANAVVNLLIGEGVDPLKLKAVGYGQDEPIATNRTLEGRRLNRRVEFRVSSR